MARGRSIRSTIGIFTHLIRSGAAIKVISTGALSAIHVQVWDLCSLIEAIVNKPFSGILNVASGTSFSVRTVIDIIADELGLPAHIEYLPSDNTAARDIAFDTSKLKRVFPSVRITPLTGGIKGYLNPSRKEDV